MSRCPEMFIGSVAIETVFLIRGRRCGGGNRRKSTYWYSTRGFSPALPVAASQPLSECPLHPRQAPSQGSAISSPVPDPPHPDDRDLLERLADHPGGIAALVALALLEATVFPGPTEAMLIALTLGRRERVTLYAVVAVAASLVGGIIGYHLGARMFDDVARPLLESYGLLVHTESVARVYRDNYVLALLTSGYTPVPYMLYTMLGGASELPLGPFAIASAAGRALKYVPIALLAYLLGPAVHRVLRRLGWWVLALLGVGVVVVLMVRC
jgi:membrane protein YqaA with SNARE-associated domain